MKSIGFSLLGILALTMAAASARAFEAGACHDDIQKYCKNAKLMGGELKECLKKHLPQLSDPCKANILDLYLEKKKSESKS